jgi:hypothetical protein
MPGEGVAGLVVVVVRIEGGIIENIRGSIHESGPFTAVYVYQF